MVDSGLDQTFDQSHVPNTAQPKNKAIVLGGSKETSVQNNYDHYIQTLQTKKSYDNAPETNYLDDNSQHNLKDDSTLKSLFQPSTVQMDRPKKGQVQPDGKIHAVITNLGKAK